MPNDKRGLASASKATRQRVASAGGSAPHQVRGFQAMDPDKQRDIASKGGRASRGGGRSKSNTGRNNSNNSLGQKIRNAADQFTSD